jgi:hypothetical protein
MSEEWKQDRIEQEYVSAQAEESTTLEYKAADALGKSDGKKREITKDVSAMANADGGIIIYGVKEYDEDDKKHLPEKIDPIDRTQFSKEWLDQVINNIRPRIDGLSIHPVDINTEPNHVVYVVEIPKGTTAHQAKDHRYYKRFNFESVPMEDYEVRDVMNRATTPDAQVEFFSKRIPPKEGEWRYRLECTVSNPGIQVINHLKLEFTFPDLALVHPQWIPAGRDASGPIGGVKINFLEGVSGKTGRYYWMTYRSRDVLFPQDIQIFSGYPKLEYWVNGDVYSLDPGMDLSLDWTLYADNMQPKRGQISIYDLWTSSQ